MELDSTTNLRLSSKKKLKMKISKFLITLFGFWPNLLKAQYMDDFDEDNDKLEPTSSSVTSRPIRSVDDNPHELLVKNTKKASTYRPITKNYPIFQRSQIQNDAPPPDEISDIVGYSYDGKPIYATGSHLWFESRKQAMKKILRVMSLIEFRLIFCYQKGFRRKRRN